MAFNRYNNTPQTKNSDMKRVQQTTIPPTVVRDSLDRYIRTVQGDRLDLLAQHYYGDPTQWVMIAAANNLHEMIVAPGLQIRIPVNTEYISREWQTQNINR